MSISPEFLSELYDGSWSLPEKGGALPIQIPWLER